eukprot:TRINITY_DN4092_c0_g1_i1.p1 TRINITY_DN4092_c0_g1~~TRINITY_DN4092_c0_g1_i1.p1  ORF type:complete len:587 (+),score=179.53 TRINITY_DN4092_c0_g1_i1:93-1853(+)
MTEIIPKQSSIPPVDKDEEEEEEESYWDYEDASGSDFEDEDDDEFFDIEESPKDVPKKEDDDDEDIEDDSFDSDQLDDDTNDDTIIYPDDEVDGRDSPKTASSSVPSESALDKSIKDDGFLPLVAAKHLSIKAISPRPQSPRHQSPRARSPRPQSPRKSPHKSVNSNPNQSQTGLLETGEVAEEPTTVNEHVLKPSKKEEEVVKKSMTRCKSYIPSLNGRWDSLQNLQQFNSPLTPRGSHSTLGAPVNKNDGQDTTADNGQPEQVKSSGKRHYGSSKSVICQDYRDKNVGSESGELNRESSSSSLEVTRQETFGQTSSLLMTQSNIEMTYGKSSIETEPARKNLRRRSRPPSIPQVPHYFGALFKRRDSDGPLPKKKRVFGVPLKIVVKSQPIKSELSNDVPNLVLEATNFLTPFAATEGLFRISGTASKVEAFVVAYNKGESIEFKNEEKDDIYVVATLLKRFFQDLPKPLLTFRLYSRFITAQSNKGPDAQEHRKVLEKLINMLPIPNRRTLQQLLKLLSEVASNHELNKMTPNNLGVCIGQELARKQKLKDPLAAVAEAKLVQALIADLISQFPRIDSAVFSK